MNVLQTLPLWGHSLAQFQWGAVVCASLAAAVFDARTRRIPNLLTLGTLVAGLVWAFVACGLAGLAESLAACLFLGFPFVLLWVFGGGGAGDAKLMGGLGAWLGLANGVITLLAVLISGAVLGLMLAVYRGQIFRVLGNMRDVAVFLTVGMWHRATLSRRPQLPEIQGLPMPYGISIFCGVLIAAAGVMLWHTHI